MTLRDNAPFWVWFGVSSVVVLVVVGLAVFQLLGRTDLSLQPDDLSIAVARDIREQPESWSWNGGMAVRNDGALSVWYGGHVSFVGVCARDYCYGDDGLTNFQGKQLLRKTIDDLIISQAQVDERGRILERLK